MRLPRRSRYIYELRCGMSNVQFQTGHYYAEQILSTGFPVARLTRITPMFGMGDTLSQAMKDAIAAYRGKITKCPDGAAEFASYVIHAAGGYHGWLGEIGILVKPVEWTWKLSERQSHLGMDRQRGERQTDEIRNDEIVTMARRGISVDEIADHFEIAKGTVRNILWQMRRAVAA